MSTALGIVILLSDRNYSIIGRFSQVQTGALAAFQSINTDDAIIGKLRIKVLEEQSVKAAPGKMFLDIKITFPDVAGSASDANYILAKKDVGEWLDSLVKNIATY